MDLHLGPYGLYLMVFGSSSRVVAGCSIWFFEYGNFKTYINTVPRTSSWCAKQTKSSSHIAGRQRIPISRAPCQSSSRWLPAGVGSKQSRAILPRIPAGIHPCIGVAGKVRFLRKVLPMSGGSLRTCCQRCCKDSEAPPSDLPVIP